MPSYDEFKRALLAQESSGNPRIINSRGFVGLYQLGEAALQDAGYYQKNSNTTRENSWTGTWTGKDGIRSLDDFRNNITAQNNAADAFFEKNVGYIRNFGLEKYIGTQITTSDGKTVTITESGLIAGAHLGGIGGLKEFLESGGAINKNDNNAQGQGKSIGDYIGQFGGYDTGFGLEPTPLPADNDAGTSSLPWLQPDAGASSGDSSSSNSFSFDNLFTGVGDAFGSIGSGIGSVFGGLGNILTASIGQALNSLPQLAMTALASKLGGGRASSAGFLPETGNDNSPYYTGGGGSWWQGLLGGLPGLFGGFFGGGQPMVVNGQPMTDFPGCFGRIGLDPVEYNRIMGGCFGGGGTDWSAIRSSVTSGDFGDYLDGAKKRSFEDAVLSVLTGRRMKDLSPGFTIVPPSKRPPFVISENGGDTRVPAMLDGLVSNLVGLALNRRGGRTTVTETDRSRQAGAAWQQSRSQQAAALARMVEQGRRNL